MHIEKFGDFRATFKDDLTGDVKFEVTDGDNGNYPAIKNKLSVPGHLLVKMFRRAHPETSRVAAKNGNLILLEPPCENPET